MDAAASMRANLSPSESVLRRLDETGIPLLIARLILGGVFIYMGVSKLADPFTFLKLIRQYEMNLPPFFLNSVAIVLPWLEVVSGAALILGIFVRGAAALMGLMLALFTPVVLGRAFDIMAAQGIPFTAVKFDCGCGGGEVFIWKKTIENSGLFLLSLVALLSCSRKFCLELWLARRDPESVFCHRCGYATPHLTAGLCEKCATPPTLPIGEPIA